MYLPKVESTGGVNAEMEGGSNLDKVAKMEKPHLFNSIGDNMLHTFLIIKQLFYIFFQNVSLFHD